MDEVRKIRFIYPPILCVVAILVAVFLNDRNTVWSMFEKLNGDGSLSSLGLAAFSFFVLLAFGYVLGTISVTVLRVFYCLARCFFCCFCCLKNKPSYHQVKNFFHQHPNVEAFLSSKNTRQLVWEKHLHGEGEIESQDFQFLASAFNHGPSLSKGHKLWIERRWNAFNLNLHSAFALILSILFVFFTFEACPLSMWIWYLTTFVFAGTFLLASWFAWYDIMRMVNLLARTNPIKVIKGKEDRQNHEASN